MMHFNRWTGLILLMCTSAFQPLRAQVAITYSDEAEKVFQDGVVAFTQERFADATTAFDQVIRSGSLNQRTTAAYVMKAKALLRQQETLEAAKTLRAFFAAFPSSTYVPDAEFTMGLLQLGIHRYGDAAASFLTAWRGARSLTGNTNLSLDARTALQRTLELHLTTGDVRQMIGGSQEPGERAFLWLTLARKEAAGGRLSAAGEIVDTLEQRYPGSPYSGDIAALRGKLTQRGNVKIGALLPIMRKSEPSAMKEIGTEIEEGVQFAVEEYALDTTARVKVTLSIRDTERDPLLAARGIQELTSDDNIVGIVGPVFSNEATAAVGLANSRGYPLVTPTANANGIAAVGPYIFQANPDYDTRGRAMARYAVTVKKMKVVAVLAPIDAFGKFMAEAFAGEALRLGAKVIASEWYQRGAADLTGQLATIRRAGMLAGADPMISFAGQVDQSDIAKLAQLGVSLATIDSLLNKSGMVKATELLGPDAKRLVDSLGITALYEDPKTDSLQYPVTTIDGIYIPISGPTEIGIASSQLVYFNFKTQILGSGEWNSFADLDANKRYCNNVIFESDYFVESASPRQTEFFNRFYERFKKRPGKNTLYGYDATRLMLEAIRTGASTREGLMRSLQAVRNYPGLHAKIGFSQSRVNSWLWILQYTGDQIRKVDEIQVE